MAGESLVGILREYPNILLTGSREGILTDLLIIKLDTTQGIRINAPAPIAALLLLVLLLCESLAPRHNEILVCLAAPVVTGEAVVGELGIDVEVLADAGEGDGLLLGIVALAAVVGLLHRVRWEGRKGVDGENLG